MFIYFVFIKGVLCVFIGEVVLLFNECEEWELLGGCIEWGEFLVECLICEIVEELNLWVEVGDLIDMYLFEVVLGKYVFIVMYVCVLVGLFEFIVSYEYKCFGLFVLDVLLMNMLEGYWVLIVVVLKVVVQCDVCVFYLQL